MNNKKGDFTGRVIISVLLVLFAVTALFVFFAPLGVGSSIENLPSLLQTVINAFTTIANPIVKGLFFVVAPAGEDQNTKMIAFAIFLLITFAGIKSLNIFFNNKGLSLLVAAIVGIIAGRSLTSSVVANSAFAAAPLAGISLFVTFVVILGVGNWVEKKSGMNQYMKAVMMLVTGIIVFFFYALIFKAVTLGIVYGAGTLILGAAQTILPFWQRSQTERENMGLGTYMAGVHNDIEIVRDMKRGSSSS